ncbi:helix-turn-helix transcriptional regulator [Sansalvadorimonas verongulae]|uniref:helix-turn-helix transcriptional regulator n=1 Tax=Sansalvadorimonas verongulae TaxID=2172824 RepID=UPI0012BD1D54|nr:helix-turn-helix transcriptional regulator [Sansalvadorimonas verongulae]MTI12146.1 XRE family transcriptional regulator [Sansalvadorimonas verongulae]
MTDLQKIGQQLKAERKRQGLKQTEVGKEAGLSHSTISLIETGNYHGSLKGFRRYLQSLGFSLKIEPQQPLRPHFDDLKGIFDDDD